MLELTKEDKLKSIDWMITQMTKQNENILVNDYSFLCDLFQRYVKANFLAAFNYIDRKTFRTLFPELYNLIQNVGVEIYEEFDDHNWEWGYAWELSKDITSVEKNNFRINKLKELRKEIS